MAQPAVAGLLIGTAVLCLVVVQQYRASDGPVVLGENARDEAALKKWLKSSAALRRAGSKAQTQQLALVSAVAPQPVQYITQVCKPSRIPRRT